MRPSAASAGDLRRPRTSRRWCWGSLCALLVGGLLAMWLLHAGPRILFLVPETWNRALFPGNPPFWSLLAELLVNILYALVLVRLPWRWLAAICLLSAALLVWNVNADPATVTKGLGELGAFWPQVIGGGLRTMFGFTAGLLLFTAWQNRKSPRRAARGALAIPVALIVLLMIDFDQRRWWDLACVLLLLPALTWYAIRWEAPYPRLTRALGDLSYPLYCIHVPILFVVDREQGPVLLVAAALVPLALLIDRFYDRPVRGFLTRLARGRMQAKAA